MASTPISLGSAPAKAARSAESSRRPFDQLVAAHAQVAREHRPAQVIRRAAARHDPLEPHASGPGPPTPDQPTRASAAWIARRA